MGAALSGALELALRAVEDEALPELRACATRALLSWAEGGAWPRDDKAPVAPNEANAAVANMIAESPAALRCLWRSFEGDLQLWERGGMCRDKLFSGYPRVLNALIALCSEPDTRKATSRGLLAAGAPASIVKRVAERCSDASFADGAMAIVRISCIRLLSVLVSSRPSHTFQLSRPSAGSEHDCSAALLAAGLGSSLFELVRDFLGSTIGALQTNTILRALLFSAASFTDTTGGVCRRDTILAEALDSIVLAVLDHHLAPFENANSASASVLGAAAVGRASAVVASCTASLGAWLHRTNPAVLAGPIGVSTFRSALRILRARTSFLTTASGQFASEDKSCQRAHLEVIITVL